jgi:hypothetical protein
MRRSQGREVPADCVQVLAAIRNKFFVYNCWYGQDLEARARCLELRGVEDPEISLVLWTRDGNFVCNSQLMAARVDEWEWQLLIQPFAAEKIRRRGPWALVAAPICLKVRRGRSVGAEKGSLSRFVILIDVGVWAGGQSMQQVIPHRRTQALNGSPGATKFCLSE